MAETPDSELIYLVGTSAHPNYGDEFVTAAWLRFLARARPEAQVVLDCPRPGLASFLYAGLHPHLRTTDLLWEVARATEGLADDEADATVDRLVTDLGTPNIDYGLLAARRASTIHFIGGGHLATGWAPATRLLRAGLRLREQSGARLIATGLTLVPSTAPEQVAGYLADFDHATLSDPSSAELAGGEDRGDDALLALDTLPAWGDRSPAAAAAGADVWVCLQDDGITEDAFEAVVTGVRTLLSSPELAGRTVRYLEALPGRDRTAYERLADLIPEENFVPFVAAWDHPFPARPGQIWLTTRFHTHLLAAASGAAGVVFEANDGYYRTKQRPLAERTGWPVVPVGESSAPAPALSDGFRMASARSHRAKVEEAEALYPRTPGRVG